MASSIAFLALAGAAGGGAVSLLPVVALHDYDDEGLGTWSHVGNHYAGATYSGATVLCAPEYAHEAYPPSTGPCIIYSPFGWIEIRLIDGVTSFSADFVTNGLTAVTIQGLDAAGNEVARSEGCDSGPDTYTRCGANAEGPLSIRTIRMEGARGYWGLDTSLFSALPLEP